MPRQPRKVDQDGAFGKCGERSGPHRRERGCDDEALTTNLPLGRMNRGYLIGPHRRSVVSNEGLRPVEGIGTYLVRFIVLSPHRP